MKITESRKKEIKARYDLIEWTLDERMRRLWTAAEAIPLGHGGVTALSKITDLSRLQDLLREFRIRWRQTFLKIGHRIAGPQVQVG